MHFGEIFFVILFKIFKLKTQEQLKAFVYILWKFHAEFYTHLRRQGGNELLSHVSVFKYGEHPGLSMNLLFLYLIKKKTILQEVIRTIRTYMVIYD